MPDGKITLIVLAGVAIGAIYYYSGINADSIFMFSFMAFLFGMPYYFNSRKTKDSGKFEKLAAATWVIFRRLICFSIAVLTFYGAVKLAFFSEVLFSEIKLSLVLFSSSIACAWIGLYGRARRVGSFNDDVILHTEKKNRYKWPW